MDYEVFVSYAREDAAVANEIVDRLASLGIACWIDKNTIAHKAGSDWAEEIVNAIKQCRIMVVVFSRHANASKYVKSEVHNAFDAELTIVPFRVEDVAPQGALELHLPRSQWLDAFPNHRPHLDRLAETICDLLDRRGLVATPVDATPQSTPQWREMLATTWRRLAPRASREPAPTATPEPAPTTRTGRDYGGRRALHEAILREDSAALGAAHRWWRVKEIIDTLTARRMPLGDFANVQPQLEERLTAFDGERKTVELVLTRFGPSRAEPLVEKLRTIVSDHPDVSDLQIRMRRMAAARERLQEKIDSLARQNRWTAIENSLRAFVREHGQATRSMLQAAQKASGHALRESRRFDILLWTVFAGAAMVAACYCVTRWLGMSDGSFSESLPEGLHSLLERPVSSAVCFGTIAAAVGFMLAAFGTHHQGSFAGVSVGLMVVVAVSQIVPWAANLLPWKSGVPLGLDIAFSVAPGIVFAMAMVVATSFAISRLLDVKTALPGIGASVAACLAGFGFLPDSGIQGASLEDARTWTRWLPEGFLCSALLAASGIIHRRIAWWLPVALVVGAGAISRPSPASMAGLSDALHQSLPVVVGLLVAGWVAARPRTVRGYAALLLVAAASCFSGMVVRNLDDCSGLLPYGRMAPLLAVWAIACGGFAIRNTAQLGPPVRPWDMLTKHLLRMRSANSNIAGRQLVETEWFREARDWHARQSAASPASRRR